MLFHLGGRATVPKSVPCAWGFPNSSSKSTGPNGVAILWRTTCHPVVGNRFGLKKPVQCVPALIVSGVGGKANVRA